MFDVKLQKILKAFAELDIKPDTTLEESKRQYRDLVQVWHPDRHSANERLQKKAEDKLKRINAAWEQVQEFYRIQEAVRLQEEEQERLYQEAREQKIRELEKEKREQEERDREELKRQQEKRERLEREERQRIARLEEERLQRERLKRELRAFDDEQHKALEVAEQWQTEELQHVLLDCPACSVTNRIPKERDVSAAKCGKCGAHLRSNLWQNLQERKGQKSFWRKLQKLFCMLLDVTIHGVRITFVALFLLFASYTSISENENPRNSQYRSPKNGLGADKTNMSSAMEAYEQGDYSKALAVFKIYAEKNDTLAQWYLGQMYFAGKGVAQNYEEAGKWYRIAAEHGDVYAQHDLGSMYQNGYGVASDYREAEKWYKRAAEQGSADSQYLLGVMYLGGKGVKKDSSEAKKWFRKAAQQGHAKALMALE